MGGDGQDLSRAPGSARRSCVSVVRVKTQKLRMGTDGLCRRADVGLKGHFAESSPLTIRRGGD